VVKSRKTPPKGRSRAPGEGTLRQRKDGYFEGRITIGYDDRGKQVTKSVYGKTRAEAAAKLAELQVKHGKGELARQGAIPLGVWLKTYAESFAGSDRRENTLEKYEGYLQLAQPIAHIHLKTLSPADLERLYRGLAAGEYGRPDKKTGEM